MMKNLVNYKSLARVAMAVVLVCAVGISLWFAAPTPVEAVNFTFTPTNPSGVVGSPLNFTVKIDITNADLLPIYRVDLHIGDAVFPQTYRDYFQNLPLRTTTTPTSITGTSGTISVSATTDAWWAQAGSGSRTGYGYGYRDPPGTWLGWGDHGFSGNLGYGYGYGSLVGPTWITYNITWTPPSSWPAGTYYITVQAWGDTDDSLIGSTSFTLSAPAPPAPPPPEPGVTDVSDIVDENGVFTEDVTAESEDGNVTVAIDEGITGLTEEGEPLSEISIVEMEEEDLPLPPEEGHIIGITYNIGPSGATFSDDITLTFTYDPDELPDGVNEADLVIAVWVAGEWVELPSVVDTENNTITATVSHFTPFAIIVPPPAPPAPPTPPAPPAPAAFSVSHLSVSRLEVEPSETVTITVLVANIGGESGSYTVVLKIDGVKEAEKTVTIAAGESRDVTFSVTKEKAASYTVTVDGLSDSFTVVPVVVPPAPAAFSVSDLSVQPAEVQPSETVTIRISVANTGGESGSYTTVLKIDGVKEAEKTVTIAADDSETVSFSVTREEAGTYTVTVDGLSGSFTVVAPPAKPISWWIWLIVGLASATAVGLLLYFFWWRQRVA